jgi:hypothetical protein
MSLNLRSTECRVVWISSVFRVDEGEFEVAIVLALELAERAARHTFAIGASGRA